MCFNLGWIFSSRLFNYPRVWLSFDTSHIACHTVLSLSLSVFSFSLCLVATNAAETRVISTRRYDYKTASCRSHPARARRNCKVSFENGLAQTVRRAYTRARMTCGTNRPNGWPLPPHLHARAKLRGAL